MYTITKCTSIIVGQEKIKVLVYTLQRKRVFPKYVGRMFSKTFMKSMERETTHTTKTQIILLPENDGKIKTTVYLFQ